MWSSGLFFLSLSYSCPRPRDRQMFPLVLGCWWGYSCSTWLRNEVFSPSLLKKPTNRSFFLVCTNQQVTMWIMASTTALLQIHHDRKDRASHWYQKSNLGICVQHRLASTDIKPTQASNVGSGCTPKPSQEGRWEPFTILSISPEVLVPSLLSAEKPSNYSLCEDPR